MTDQQPQKITISIDLNSLNIIAAGLGKLPMEVALNVFNDIQQQARSQIPDEVWKATTEEPGEDVIKVE